MDTVATYTSSFVYTGPTNLHSLEPCETRERQAARDVTAHRDGPGYCLDYCAQTIFLCC